MPECCKLLYLVCFYSKMGLEEEETNGVPLPPPPPVIPPGVTLVKESELELPKSSTAPKSELELPKSAPAPKRFPMARNGLASKGTKIQLLTNHFQVKMPNSDGYFYQYSVCLISDVFLLVFDNDTFRGFNW